jgi:WhiB family redox-sensing transcriptional regulator
MDQALCHEVSPELFFPAPAEHPTAALKVCALCPVRVECLEYALLNDERWGVWGGLTAYQRCRKRRPDALCARCHERPTTGVWRHCPECRSEVQAEKHGRYRRTS